MGCAWFSFDMDKLIMTKQCGTGKWELYTGSPEQIAEIRNAMNGYVMRYDDGSEMLHDRDHFPGFHKGGTHYLAPQCLHILGYPSLKMSFSPAHMRVT